MSRNGKFSKDDKSQSYNEKDSKRSQKRGKQRRNSSSGSERKDSDLKSLDSARRDNDPNWYFTDKTLAEQVCHLSFNSFIGEGYVNGTAYAIPSIVRFMINPSPFNSYDITNETTFSEAKRSGLNLAITKLYTLLASYSGRAATYAPQDVGTMVLAMGEIVSCIEDLRRAVGVSYTFSNRNRALPKVLTSALGYDYDDFIRNRALYIDRLNAIITRFNSLPILGNVAYILKCRDMYQKVYSDSLSPEATLIVMVPYTTWVLDEQSYQGGTVLKTTQWTPAVETYSTFGDHLDILDSMVEALFGSTTLNTIYADLLNLASKTKVDMFKLDYVTNDYIVIPEYNENFLLQIHNADLIGYPTGVGVGPQVLSGNMSYTPLNNVYPDPDNNMLVYNPIFKYSLPEGRKIHYMSIIDLPDSDPSVENVLEATRYKAISDTVWHLPTPNEYVVTYSCIPDHYIVTMHIFTNSTSKDAARSIQTNWTWPDFVDAGNYLNIIASQTQIDWAPLHYRMSNGNNAVINMFGDLNFYTQIGADVLGAMNRIIAQDLFDFRI